MQRSSMTNAAKLPKARPGEELLGIIRSVMPGYFRTIGIPLQRGRDFNARDNAEAAPYRFIVNEAFAKKYLANENPLGKSINALMDTQNPFWGDRRSCWRCKRRGIG
jgi:putative ABC transport system permease protein